MVCKWGSATRAVFLRGCKRVEVHAVGALQLSRELKPRRRDDGNAKRKP